MKDDPKKSLRRIRNRRSAQESRDRKRQLVESLEVSNEQLSAENESLKKRMKKLEDHQNQLLEKLMELSRQVHSNGIPPPVCGPGLPSTTAALHSHANNITDNFFVDNTESPSSKNIATNSTLMGSGDESDYSLYSASFGESQNLFRYNDSLCDNLVLENAAINNDCLNRSDESTVGTSSNYLQKQQFFEPIIPKPNIEKTYRPFDQYMYSGATPVVLGCYAVSVTDPFLGRSSSDSQPDFYISTSGPMDNILSSSNSSSDNLETCSYSSLFVPEQAWSLGIDPNQVIY